MSEPLTLARLMEAGVGRTIATRDCVLRLDDFAVATSLGADLPRLAGRSVVLAVGDMAKAAAALIELDGTARRIVLCPPGFDMRGLDTVARLAEADAVVYDSDAPAPETAFEVVAACRLPLAPLRAERMRRWATEWVMPTSGTSGPPKLVAHTLATLTGPFRPAGAQRWATFYDIRRYGGLQIFLRALSGTESLTLSTPGESVDAFLGRLGEAGAKHISGTPSHWRKVL
ncbi:MAG: long-chain fatty acid--CoA ligase, partial [Hyphomicrobiales bacterium]|nr:long-chain fatty acid--CoA ligase [Hyphomicrobiales bacterium]